MIPGGLEANSVHFLLCSEFSLAIVAIYGESSAVNFRQCRSIETRANMKAINILRNLISNDGTHTHSIHKLEYMVDREMESYNMLDMS